jgi:hypothetical protein
MFILKQTRSYVVFEANCCHPKCIYEVHDAYYWDGEALTIRFFFVGRGRVCSHSILAVSEDEKYRLLGCWALNYHVGSTMTFSKYPK